MANYYDWQVISVFTGSINGRALLCGTALQDHTRCYLHTQINYVSIEAVSMQVYLFISCSNPTFKEILVKII